MFLFSFYEIIFHSLKTIRKILRFPLISGKLWLNEPDMTWKTEMPPVPSSEESKIALQSRLGLSPPGKYLNLKFIVWIVRNLSGTNGTESVRIKSNEKYFFSKDFYEKINQVWDNISLTMNTVIVNAEGGEWAYTEWPKRFNKYFSRKYCWDIFISGIKTNIEWDHDCHFFLP